MVGAGRTLVSETVLSDVWNPFQDIPFRCLTAALKSFRRRALPAEAGAAQPDESEKWDAHFRTDFALEKGSQAGSSGLLCLGQWSVLQARVSSAPS